MAAAVAAELSKADPANATAYEANAAAFAASLDAVSADIATELAPVKGKPFIVFHDAYQYFEKRFGLDAAGSISDVSAQAPSAERLKRGARQDQAAAKAPACSASRSMTTRWWRRSSKARARKVRRAGSSGRRPDART